MANRHMKRCSKLPNMKEIVNQNYNEVSPHISQNGHHQNIYKQINAGEDVEKIKPFCIVGGNIN